MTSDTLTIKHIAQKFIDFETNHDVFNKTIEGVYYWHLIRFDLYIALLIDLGVYEMGNPSSSGRHYKIQQIKQNVKDLIFRNPFFKKISKDSMLILPHPRMNEGIDIYSQNLITSCEQNKTILAYSTSTQSTYKNAVIFSGAALRSNFKTTILKRVFKKYFDIPSKYINEISALESEFQTLFQVKTSLKKRIVTKIIGFKEYENTYLKFLRKTKPKSIFMVVHYSYFALISAAKKLSIPTYEIQHGTISNNHMGYYFPHIDTPPYFPDCILCHGEHWAKKPPLPSGVKTIITGAPHVTGLDKNYDKIPKTVLIYSQGPIAGQLLDYALRVAELATEYQIIYRLHPAEKRSYYHDKLSDKKLPSNFRLSTQNDDDFFDLLSTSEFVCSVYSTTLYEAMALGGKAIVIGLEGYTAVEDIVLNGDAILAKTPQDFIQALKKSHPCSNKDYYYKPFNKDVYKNLKS